MRESKVETRSTRDAVLSTLYTSMKPYTVAVDINAPLDLVLELFDDPDNLPKWQRGFVSWTLREGEQGQVGAIADVVFENKGRRIDMTEEVTARNLPEQFDGLYRWGKNHNTVTNRFIAIDDDTTRWEATCAYTLNSVGMKLMGLLFGKKFREQDLEFLQDFKAFCEDGVDVRTGERG